MLIVVFPLQAKMVAAATHSMCEAANTMVQGNASEEKLIASAKEVAASTAALLVACRVKADPGSQAMQRLQVSLGVKNKSVISTPKAQNYPELMLQQLVSHHHQLHF